MAVPIKIDNIVKYFGSVTALNHVSIDISPGELFFLLGPSGCGKTTLLRHIAGFYTPDEGKIIIDGVDVTTLPPHKRDTGMVFQSYALWPHMTLAENVAFGLKMRKVSKPDINKRVMEALDLVKMADKADRKPNQLSGGQQQRVALARALVVEPRCLLLDEPLSNLDAKLRLEMRMEIRRICKDAGLTAVYVTHDQKEALSIADRLAVMKDGVIEQVGTPLDVFRSPVNSFVASFIGETNFLPANFFGDKFKTSENIKVLSIRPEALSFHKIRDNDIPLKGVMHGTVYLGETAQHILDVESADGQKHELKVFQLNPELLARDDSCEVNLWINPSDIITLEK